MADASQLRARQPGRPGCCGRAADRARRASASSARCRWSTSQTQATRCSSRRASDARAIPSWYYNIKANPEVTLEAKGLSARFVAREVEGEDRARLYELAKQLYTGYGSYEERTAGIRRVPVLRLTQI